MIHLRHISIVFAITTGLLSCKTVSPIDKKINALIKQMTIEEKAGQLNQYSADFPTGPVSDKGDVQDQIRRGLIGSFLNASGAARTRELQSLAMQSRLKIPLLFGQDVLHGYRTVLPIPLAEACSWDLALIERSAQISAIETSAVGIHWTFAPMVDISRDPRWGRVMEGGGEDPFLGAKIAAARVRGFQGDKLGQIDRVMATAKHFAAYGGAIGGRDYNSVDVSGRTLHELYLPPFKAAKDAGVASFMNAFNDINGVPASAHQGILRDLLKGQWQYDGIVVSDWSSIMEMQAHGYASDLKDASRLAINAGTDIDMESRGYIQFLPELVKHGKVKSSLVDDAVRRVLRKKFELGLFEDPYKYCSVEREKATYDLADHRDHARNMAAKSIVLLKNENKILPLDKNIGSIALIGPLVKSQKDHLGFWSYDWPDDSVRLVSLYDGVKHKISRNTTINYAYGCGIQDTSRSGFADAIAAAQKSEVVIMHIGEDRIMTGEARSRSDISIPGVQEELVAAVKATGKPVIVLIGAGRPTIFNTTREKSDAILYTWWLGIKAGDAMADVLFGDVNPSAKLAMTFPRSVGQIPIYYNHLPTGRPAKSDDERFYVSAYNDLPNSPAYPFGYGLSYSQFTYGEMMLNDTIVSSNNGIKASIEIINTSQIAGEEIVQLYIRDNVASLSRPIKELKDFQKISLAAGEKQEVTFTIDVDDLSFYTDQGQKICENGTFTLMIGPSSDKYQSKTIHFITKK